MVRKYRLAHMLQSRLGPKVDKLFWDITHFLCLSLIVCKGNSWRDICISFLQRFETFLWFSFYSVWLRLQMGVSAEIGIIILSGVIMELPYHSHHVSSCAHFLDTASTVETHLCAQTKYEKKRDHIRPANLQQDLKHHRSHQVPLELC